MFKGKEEVIVIAVLAIIATALLSGYGVYYFLSLRPVKITKSQPLQKSSTLKNSSPTTITQPPKTNEENTPANNKLQSAQTVLENFFSYLANKQYKEAATLYGWGHDDDPGNSLQTWAGANNTETLKNYCENLSTCLKIKVLTGAKTNDDTYKFLVQFIENNGETFKHSSYPGAETMIADFNFSVKKIDNQFKVINPPLFFP